MTYHNCSECEDAKRMQFFKYVETLVEVLSRPKIVSIKSSRGENLESGGSFWADCPYCMKGEYWREYS